MSDACEHKPVMMDKVIAGLQMKPDGVYIDGTFGRGGHSRIILNQLGEKGILLALDKDPEAIVEAKDSFSNDERFKIRQDSFANIRDFVEQNGLAGKVDGVLLDLGVSSPQLDKAERGFSFLKEGPLDMRMDPASGESAADWIARTAVKEMSNVFKKYGDERYANRIANAIATVRTKKAITSTTMLADVISKANPSWEQHKHPATRCFQAIRIQVNKELDDLEESLPEILDVLAVGGRLVVMSFHSLEDRIVKQFINEQAKGTANFPAKMPVTEDKLCKRLRKVGRFQRASDEEIAYNVRARSAVLRIAEKIA